MYKCKYCGKEFDNKNQLGGHTCYCKYNPNYNENIEKLKKSRCYINYENKHLHCKYCNIEVYNEACLKNHETHCIKNPNAILNNYKINKIIKEQYNLKRMPISEIGRINMSQAAKERCKKYPETCGWKNQKSVPCENLKQYLRNKGINFIEEYIPYNDRFFALDIAWPDEKIAIEVNGNQHYNKDGSLNKYYQERHDFFEKRGWKIFEIHYSKCYNININNFDDILNLPIYDKNYINNYLLNNEIKKQEKLKLKEIKKKQKQEIEEQHKQIIYNLINNSGIDFTKSGWSKQAINYLLNRNELWNKGIFRCIRKYYPEFLQRNDIYKRKGSKI